MASNSKWPPPIVPKNSLAKIAMTVPAPRGTEPCACMTVTQMAGICANFNFNVEDQCTCFCFQFNAFQTTLYSDKMALVVLKAIDP
jgi:hypothetical protein